ncbi:MAG: NUDIX hydrolase [Candidatus Omnitrophica bacterium]|nr:NUDIX hydrolase [Candidatus Omnitrophota bacterium]
MGYLTYMQKKIEQGPFITVDVIIEIDKKIVLIKRKNPPFGWALPGGFVDYGESLEDAVMREAKEETNLELENLKQFHTYSDPHRDPRFHTISTVFIGKGKGEPKADSDAQQVELFPLNELPSEIAFDHREILEDYSKEMSN